jgi:hypothetical protein
MYIVHLYINLESLKKKLIGSVGTDSDSVVCQRALFRGCAFSLWHNLPHSRKENVRLDASSSRRK